MRLTVLGSGTSVPHPRRASSSHWLETAGGTLLLDCSAPAAHRAAQEGFDWAALDAVWISHFHLDHVGGLAPFLFGTKYAPQTQERKKPLTIYGPAGLGELLRAFDAADDYGLLKQPFPVETKDVSPGDSFDILPGVRAETFPTPHTDESLAVKITDTSDNSSLVYTSDTGYVAGLADFAANVSLFLMECSFRAEKPVETHLVLSEAMRLASRARPGRVMLSHLYPEWDGHDLETEARELWDGETIEARDGLRIAVSC
ncbi:MAG TPA: ribonuclease Z [Pyrinomonadaceae bacterium]|nr:ribonuclease Z [Pyrinomonadaceae bacterium]